MGTPEHTIASLRSAGVVLAGERRIPVGGPLGSAIPGGGLVRGTVVAVCGPPGSGAGSVTQWLLAAATATGEWAGVVDPDGVFGALAAEEAGVELDRLAVVRGVPARQWPRVVATLLEGLSVVAAAVPPRLSAADERRLVARARERSAVLIASGGWSAEAALRLAVTGSAWPGLDEGAGSLGGGGLDVAPGARRLRVTVTGRGAAARGRVVDLVWPALPGGLAIPAVEVGEVPAEPPGQVAV
jgi:hypothetical protein